MSQTDEKSNGEIKAYLFEIGKIVEGSLRLDNNMVIAYLQQLRDKLAGDGYPEAAKRLDYLLKKNNAPMYALASAGTMQAAPVPVDSESRLSIADESHPSLEEASVILPEDIDKLVKKFIAYIKSAGKLRAGGVGISPSLLIYGPPGCGKTQLAKYISASLNLPLLTARTDGLISSYLGSTAKNLRALFDHAASRPCVLFLDEFDALAKMRDDAKELGELKRVVISLLQNIDAIGEDHVLIAATNHDHLLDPAIWRRFARHIELGPPSFPARQQMLNEFFRGFGSPKLSKYIALVTEGLTGADLRKISEETIRDSILESDTATSIRDVLINAIALKKEFRGMRVDSLALPEQVKLVYDASSKQITQRDLASIFKTTQPTISNMLKGVHDGNN